VVEVHSAKTASSDRGEIYERNGVREYWLFDWRSRELTVFRLDGARFDRGTVFHESDRVASAVLPGLGFLTRELLPPP
jgi:Uma2 family endonuclease